MGDFTSFTAFHGRDFPGDGDIICLVVGKREEECPDGRLPLNVGDLAALDLDYLQYSRTGCAIIMLKLLLSPQLKKETCVPSC